MPKVLAAFIARGIGAVYETSGPGEEEELAVPRDSKWRDHDCRRRRRWNLWPYCERDFRSATPCRLAVVPSGTGNDFAKNARSEPVHSGSGCRSRSAQKATRIDVGLLTDTASEQLRIWIRSLPFSRRAIAFVFSRGTRFTSTQPWGQLFTYRGIEVSANGVPNVKRGECSWLPSRTGARRGRFQDCSTCFHTRRLARRVLL